MFLLMAVLELSWELGRVSNFDQSINWKRHMKGNAEIVHLSKFDAFRLKAMDFKTYIIIHTNVSNFPAASHKTRLTLKNIFSVLWQL